METGNKRFRNFVLYATLIPLFVLAIPALFNFYYDPFRIFHESPIEDLGYSRNERFQTAGFINRFLTGEKSPEAIVIGTSISQNFHPSKIAKTLDWDGVLRLTVAGGMPIEKRYIAEKALRTRKVKFVLWEIYSSYHHTDPTREHPRYSFPYYLYTANPFDDASYIFNLDTLSMSLRLVFKRMRYSSSWRQKDLETYNNWFVSRVGSFEKFNAKKSLHEIDALLEQASGNNVSYQYVDRFPSLDENVLTVVRKHPQTKFILFFPPVSTAFYAKSKNAYRNRLLSMRRYLVENVKHLKNVEVHAIDTQFWIVNNLANYKDWHHFDQYINDVLPELIKKGVGRLTQHTIDDYEREFLRNVKNYNKAFSDCSVLPYTCAWLKPKNETARLKNER